MNLEFCIAPVSKDAVDRSQLARELQRLYPITPMAKELGVVYAHEIRGDAVAYRSDWNGLAILRDSELGRMLELPFMRRAKGVGQLGPDRVSPYPYTHTVFDHEAEQVVGGVARLAWLAQTQEALFLDGTAAYRAPATNPAHHTRFILRVAAWWFCLHDAESLPLRDTAKFAFAVRGVSTDENVLLAQRLADPTDTKYRPHLQKTFDSQTDEAIAVLIRLARRQEPSFLGEFLHSPPLPDDSDPTGMSRPLDADRITYTIQDLLRVFGEHMFSSTVNLNQHAVEFFPYADMLYLALNLTALRTILDSESDHWVRSMWEKLYVPMKIHPSQIDLLRKTVLARGWDGNIHLAYKDPGAVFNFFTLSSLGNFPGLYLTPEMIFTEKQFEWRIRRHFLKWNIPKRNRFLHRITDWTDEELLAWLTKHWPDAVYELNTAREFTYEHDYVPSFDGVDQTTGDVVFVPVKIHPGTATFVVNQDGVAVPFSSFDKMAADDFRADLNRYHGKLLIIRRYKKRGDQFFRDP